ncbi:alpha/beta hydrolase [Halalkalibacterium halodurans]|uniref:alpha/beta hydrolase n=1 Tax=Halalkalibacterium halodurans TaxID=86665 RepID=UPI00106833F9|nr:alpha/beta hydrolase [Halalkalibacterium halodurans]MED3645749.1 alpha/beta hydrolase [Halalkalibacterium halodurans]TES52875.1 alpha/beta hydrolase [Halalkalibacterium halodurans]
MKHIFRKGADPNAPTLLLLHGTGGNEHDLVPLAEMISPGSSILGVRGNVLENGMPRFFRRIAEGVFDEEDLVIRTKELHEFLDDAVREHAINRNRLVAIGYSNGANIAVSLLYHYEQPLMGAILFKAMVPLRNRTVPDLQQMPIFIGAGKYDPLIPQTETKELINTLTNAGANVYEQWIDGGHQLTREEVERAKEWFNEQFLEA